MDEATLVAKFCFFLKHTNMINRSHQDIFEKLLQDIARIIAELIGSSTIDPIVALEQAKQHYLQLQEGELEDIDPDDLLGYLLDKEYSHQQLSITAQFLYAEGEVLEKSDVSEAKKRRKQALVILEFLEEHSDIYSQERRDRIGRLINITVDATD